MSRKVVSRAVKKSLSQSRLIVCGNDMVSSWSSLSAGLFSALPTTFMFMTAWVFEARHCPTLLNEIKKTKLQIYTEPQAGINILLAVVGLRPSS
jgi:hypothetical protein